MLTFILYHSKILKIEKTIIKLKKNNNYFIIILPYNR